MKARIYDELFYDSKSLDDSGLINSTVILDIYHDYNVTLTGP